MFACAERYFAEHRERGTRLQGAGATFPGRFINAWWSSISSSTRCVIDLSIVGSGGGINAITEQNGHFCASDAPMNKKELATAGATKDRRNSGLRGRNRTNL